MRCGACATEGIEPKTVPATDTPRSVWREQGGYHSVCRGAVEESLGRLLALADAGRG